MRADKPWETHLKKNKQNAAFKEKHYFIFQNKTAIEEAIKPYISKDEFKEIFKKGNKLSQLLEIEIDICQLIDDIDIPEPYIWKNDIVM
jgi:putative membrane protein